MKVIKTVNACGHILCHDITQIIKDKTKDAIFKKGHIVTEEDIPILLSLGKDSLYVWEKQENMLHENDAAEILYKLCADNNMSPTPVKEGKINVIANESGLLKINKEKVKKINSLGEIIIATIHNNVPVKKGDQLAGTRIIPLTINKEKLNQAVTIGDNTPILTIKKFKEKKFGVVTTGNEIYHKRIKDTFTPVIVEKVSEYGGKFVSHTILDDNHTKITETIIDMKNNGVEVIFCTGGMSVDPDDCTPTSIRNTGANIISYGAPVLPGAMFMLGYLDNIPILGLPGCVMYSKKTIFDLILPRIMADDPITKDEIASMGVGGLCLSCPTCTYPNCGFGKY